MKKEILYLHNICFEENAVKIVRHADFRVFAGEIVGLAGRNHSGKTTLLGAATGEFPAKTGIVYIKEQKKVLRSIEQARKEGIFLIKPSGSLIDNFSIRDTLKLNFAFARKKYSYKEYAKKCNYIIDLLKIKEPADTYIADLSFHKRLLIEMAQAVICNSQVLVLDNVVSLLSASARKEMTLVFNILRIHGISLVLIENEANCILPYLDRLCIMRKGRITAELGRDEMELPLILSLIEGETLPPKNGVFSQISPADSSKKLLDFSHIYTWNNKLKDLTFSLYEGETLGLWNKNYHSGKALFALMRGNLPVLCGTIRVNGNIYSPEQQNVQQHKLMLIPEEDDFFTNMNLGANICFSALKSNSSAGIVLKKGRLLYLTHDLLSEYFCDEGYRLFANQFITDNPLIKKKASICRAVACGARIIIYDNPCLKMDLHEKALFYQDILRTQKKKTSQLIISAYLDTLYPVCNRILQIHEGKIIKEIAPEI